MAETLRTRRYGISGMASNAFRALQSKRRIHINLIYGGNGQFSNPPNDPITLNGRPYQTRLRVFEERSGRLVREAWSAADGTWTISDINPDYKYLIVCYDAEYPALCYDNQTPDPMT